MEGEVFAILYGTYVIHTMYVHTVHTYMYMYM